MATIPSNFVESPGEDQDHRRTPDLRFGEEAENARVSELPSKCKLGGNSSILALGNSEDPGNL